MSYGLPFDFGLSTNAAAMRCDGKHVGGRRRWARAQRRSPAGDARRGAQTAVGDDERGRRGEAHSCEGQGEECEAPASSGSDKRPEGNVRRRSLV